MTTVQIDAQSPGVAAWAEEVRALLGRQPGRGPEWAGRLLETITAGPAGVYDAYIRAVDGDRLAGAALVLTRVEAGDAEPRPWLAALWVDSELRGRGLGRKLLGVAETGSRERGADELVITVNPEDDTTLFLGERWGYFRERVLLSRNLE